MTDPWVVLTTMFARVWIPPELAGVTNVRDVEEFTVTPVAATPPTVTPVVPLKFVPVSVTDVPPAVDP